MRKQFVICSIALVIAVLLLCTLWKPFVWLFLIILPAIAVGVFDMFQEEHSLRRNFPLVSRGRWFLESLRPFLRQYLFESETDGVPINRMFRSVVYQRAKGMRDTVPFGTKMDTYRDGYEWIAHSIAATDSHSANKDPRVLVGGPDCSQPYSASVLNISAMSFGSLSKNAVLALNTEPSSGASSLMVVSATCVRSIARSARISNSVASVPGRALKSVGWPGVERTVATAAVAINTGPSAASTRK